MIDPRINTRLFVWLMLSMLNGVIGSFLRPLFSEQVARLLGLSVTRRMKAVGEANQRLISVTKYNNDGLNHQRKGHRSTAIIFSK